MGVSINGGTPEWMVDKGKSHLEMDDLGVPPFVETPKWPLSCFFPVILVHVVAVLRSLLVETWRF